MRILLIVNTSASSVTARARVVIHKALAADHDVRVAETARRGHATRLARGAAAEGAGAVVVLGGDGTVNEAANGLVDTPTALGVLPGGSTNVFARTIGMTNDPIEATGELMAALATGAIRAVSLGVVNGRYFLFHVGLGFDAAVVAAVERRSTIKRYLGHAVFLSAAVATWSGGYDRHRPHFSARLTLADGSARTVGDGYLGICLKTNPYTYLGEHPLDLAPGTGLDSPLCLVTLRRLDLPTLLGVTTAALRGGRRVAGRRHVDVAPEVDTIVIEAGSPLPYQVDGDYLGEAEHLELRWERDRLRLIVPAAGGSSP